MYLIPEYQIQNVMVGNPRSVDFNGIPDGGDWDRGLICRHYFNGKNRVNCVEKQQA